MKKPAQAAHFKGLKLNGKNFFGKKLYWLVGGWVVGLISHFIICGSYVAACNKSKLKKPTP